MQPGINPANIPGAQPMCQLEAAPRLPPLISPARNRAGRLHSLPPLQGGARNPHTGSRRGTRPSAVPSRVACKVNFPGREVWVCGPSLAAQRHGAKWAAPRAPPVSGAQCAPPPARRSSGRSARVARPRAFSVRRAGGEPGSCGRVLGEGWSPGGRMALATRSQVRVWQLAAAATPLRPAFPVRLALLPPWAGNVALGCRVVERARPVPRTLERARPAGVRSGSRLCQPDWRA